MLSAPKRQYEIALIELGKASKDRCVALFNIPDLGSIDAGKEAVLNVVCENRQDMEEQLI